MLNPLCTPIGQALEAKLEECASADAANTLLDEHAIDIDAQQPFGLETVDMALSRGLNHLIRHVQKSVPPAPRFDISFKDLKYMAKVRQGGGNDVVTVGTQVHLARTKRHDARRCERSNSDTWHSAWQLVDLFCRCRDRKAVMYKEVLKGLTGSILRGKPRVEPGHRPHTHTRTYTRACTHTHTNTHTHTLTHTLRHSHTHTHTDRKPTRREYLAGNQSPRATNR
jgi:hypothetical protein